MKKYKLDEGMFHKTLGDDFGIKDVEARRKIWDFVKPYLITKEKYVNEHAIANLIWQNRLATPDNCPRIAKVLDERFLFIEKLPGHYKGGCDEKRKNK